MHIHLCTMWKESTDFGSPYNQISCASPLQMALDYGRAQKNRAMPGSIVQKC